MIIQRFENQVKKTPSALAVKTLDQDVSYARLNQWANRVAHMIDSALELPGKQACLLFDHGPAMIAALLGTLKAGLVYVPLSPNYPDQRLEYMVSHSQASLIIADSANIERARRIASQLGICALEDNGDNPVGDLQNPQPKALGNELLYILYTSGSTGKPKGVVQTGGNVLHFTDCYRDKLGITSGDRLTLLSSFSHDAAVMDIYTALLNGAALYPLDMREYDGNPLLHDWLAQEEITVWHSVPTLFRFFVNQLTENISLPHLRYIVLGGERVLANDVVSFRRFFPGAMLYNLYGQTESTFNSGALISPSENLENITLGDPIPETTLFVVDENNMETDPFEVGEIVVAGPHLSPGYWKDEENTRTAFASDEELGALYFTGDLGRILPQGGIEYMGRKDTMVKLRGYRVELGEIESRLSAHSAVSQAVVAIKEEKNTSPQGSGDENLRLCAYIECKKPGQEECPDSTELKSFLAQGLPDYMIPGTFIFLDTMPLTASGKVDRRALPEPETVSDRNVVPPGNATEEQLLEIWAGVLPTPKEEIGVESDFFELGGHSLRATTMLSRVHRIFEVRIPVSEIFRTSTIRGLAVYIGKAGKESFDPIKAAPPQEHYPVSPLQQRLYILYRLGRTHTAYNMKSIHKVEGKLDPRRLEKVLLQLLQRHENLRTSFHMEDERLVQVVHQNVEFELERYDYTQGEPDDLFDRFVRPFDLAKPPLMRAGLICLEDDSYILMRDTHHIASDGTSQMTFIKELLDLYSGKSLPPPGIQYKDYCQWLENRKPQLEKQASYWAALFEKGIPVMDNFVDFPRPKVQSFEGDLLCMEFNQELTTAIHRFNSASGVTLFMFLLAVYNVLLFKYTGHEDIVLGAPTSGRSHPDTEGVMGLFINVLVMRNYPANHMTFQSFLDRVRSTTAEAFENGDYPFGDLLDMLGKTNEISRNPVYDLELVVQNMEIPSFKNPEIQLKNYHNHADVSQVDATLYAVESVGKIFFRMVYNRDLFKKETMKRFLGHFEDVVNQVLKNKDIELGNLVISHDLLPATTDAYDEIAGDLDF